jgi:hypothetical protein
MSIDLIRCIAGEKNKPNWQIQHDMENLCREKLGEADWREPNYKVIVPSLSALSGAYRNKILIRIEKTPEEIRASDAYKQAQLLKGVEITQKSSRGHFHISVSSEAGASHRKALQAIKHGFSERFADQVFDMKATLCMGEEVITLRTIKGSEAEKFFANKAQASNKAESLIR